MRPRALFSSLRSLLAGPAGLACLGGVFIGVIAAMAIYDIVRGYHNTVENTGRELDAQARVVAEQTERTFQAVDVQLRQLAQQYHRGTLSALGPEELRLHLKDYAAGLVQIEGLLLVEADGRIRASSYMSPEQEREINISSRPLPQIARAAPSPALIVSGAERSRFDGKMMFPMARRLETPGGEYAGLVAARGRIDYFEQFYRDVQLDRGTKITLMHQNGTLIARHPRIEEAIGRHIPLFDEILAAHNAGNPEPTRSLSPVDGVERFRAIALVPGYPLAIIVSRETAVALAPWRAQAVGSIARTAALAAFAALLLAIAMRQVSRLNAATRSLQASQDRFALAVSGSNDGIIDWDIVNDRMYSSERAMRIVGIESGVTVRTRAQWRDLVKYHPDDWQRMKDDLESFLAGHTELRDGVYRVLHPNGEYRWIRHRNRCVRDSKGNPIRVAGSVSDIDSQKRAEAALRESQERYQLAVEGANQGLWDWDFRTDSVFVSPRAQEFMGLTPGQPLRTRREWIELSPYHPDDRDAVRAALSAHLRGTAPYFVVEHRMRHPSGPWHWYRQRGVALRDDNGRPYRMAGSMEDITEYRNAEAERRNLEGQLLQAKKLEAIGTLAGGIAHDFNNILAAILGYGDMAQKNAPEGTPLRRHVDAMVSAGMRAKSLVERILAFSRSGTGERVPVHVQSVVGEALDLAAASFPRHVRLDCRFAAEGAAVMGDPTQIHQVVMNLCANATHAMKSEGTLTVALDVVEKGDAMAATSALASGRYVRLRVSDTGTGIPPEVLERIFDPFFTTREVGVGTGLGLSLVHGIVTDLGGGIDVESSVGKGTTFTVYLPWSDSVAAPAVAPEIVPHGSGETVMLVDDEETLVRLGEEMIAALGYEPVGFTSGTAALEAFRASPERFNVVLTDETMPGLTGAELARAIHAVCPDRPVVLMSGFVSTALSARARDAGVVAVLAKPLATHEIARTLASALR